MVTASKQNNREHHNLCDLSSVARQASGLVLVHNKFYQLNWIFENLIQYISVGHKTGSLCVLSSVARQASGLVLVHNKFYQLNWIFENLIQYTYLSDIKPAVYASLVQLVERRSPKPDVEGSSPSGRDFIKT